MSDRRKTMAALKRLADRPGTPGEGAVARAMLERMEANTAVRPAPKPFRFEDFPIGCQVYYNRWAYPENDPCIVFPMKTAPHFRTIEGQIWMRLSFTHLKRPRWVPVTSSKGCHISLTPLSPADAEYLRNPCLDPL